jgi:hypothetical protein
MANTGERKQLGHWTERVFRITSDCPLAGLRADSKISDGSVRKKASSLPGGRRCARLLSLEGPERHVPRILPVRPYPEHQA